MTLDEALPKFDVAKRHYLAVVAPPARSFAALQDYDLRDSFLPRVLMRLRGYGSRMRAARGGARAPLAETLTRFGFVFLGEEPGRELVFGIAGKFWRPDGGLRRLTAEEFPGFAEPGYAKAAWNLLVEENGPGRSFVSTETRVLCLGEDVRRKFLLYWRVIEPWAGLIRISLLRGIRSRALAGAEGSSKPPGEERSR